MSAEALRRALASCLTATVASLGGCTGGERLDARVEVSDVASAGSFGRFLEQTPPFAAAEVAPRRLVRARPGGGFRAGYERIAVARGDGTPDLVFGSFFAGEPAEGARFAFACAGALAPELALAVFTRRGHAGGSFELRARGGSVRVALTAPEHRLLSVRSPLPQGFCVGRDEDELVLHLPEGAGRSWLLAPPALLVRDETARAPVVLISLDTLRADRWRDASDRPPALEALRRDSIVFERAFSAYPTTDHSHSVLFSGLAPGRAVRAPVDEKLSFVPALRDAGFETLGFVAGGHLRALRGFGAREPGFALGFDLYLEELSLRPPPPAAAAETTLGRERRKQTHTLGPALERSLRWFAAHPGELAFHFLHGFDVHEYRSVERSWWEATLAAHTPGRGREAVDACMREVGAEEDDAFVVHFPNAPLFRDAQTGRLGPREPCHRLLGDLLYEARIRSVEAMLARYVEGLRALGVYDRALVIVTSDHGEGLLDETDWNGDAGWGHNRILANNLAVPLWLKLPGAARAGTRVSEPAGLLDLRATLGKALGVDLGAGDGVDALRAGVPRARPLPFASNADGFGFVLADGGLCAWKGDAAGGAERSRRFRDGRWSEAAAADPACDEVRRRGGASEPALAAPVPAELRDELRELGYTE